MLIGARNWYTEMGVTPVHTGTDSGNAYYLDRLAKPWCGAISRSTKIGSVNFSFGAAGIGVQWPRALPIRLVGVLGMRNPYPNEGATFTFNLMWRLYLGGPSGTLVAGSGLINLNSPSIDFFDGIANNIVVDLGARYVGDYLHLEWYRDKAAPDPFDMRGLWASDAFYINADGQGFEPMNDSTVQASLAGGDFTTDRRVYRRASVTAEMDSLVLSPADGDDTIESFAELLAVAGNSAPVVFYRSTTEVGPKELTLHGTLISGTGIQHMEGPICRVTAKAEEL